ncbi:TPA: Cochaperone protein [Trebouxia sp. C0004]
MNIPDTVSDDEAEVLLSYEDRVAAIAKICKLLKEAKLEEALDGASMLVEMFPDKPKLQADLSGILFRMGEYDSAELHASIAVDLDPANVTIRHFRAMCSEKRQDYLCAQADYQAVAFMCKHKHQKVSALKQSERVELQLTAMCEQSSDRAAVGKKENRRTVASAMAKIAELEATANWGLEIHAEARYLSSFAKSDAHSNQTANAQIRERNHSRAQRRSAQQNVTTAPEEEDCLTVISDAQTRHRTAHRVITAELEDEDWLTVAPLAEHGNDAPEEEGDDSQLLRMSSAQRCIKGSHFCPGATTPASAAAAAPAAGSLQSTLTSGVHSLSDCSCQSCPSSDCGKPQSLSGLSSSMAKQDSNTSYSMPTNNRLQRDGGRHQTDEDGAGAMPQSSPESVHEPLLITSKRQVLPLSWSKTCRTPGNPSVAQMSTAYALKKAGDAAYHNKLYSDALDMYSQCIEISPGNAILLNNRASVHLRLGHWDDAIADSNAALHVVPRPNGLNVSQAHCRLAKAWQAKGNIAVGLAVVHCQLQKDPAHQALNTLQAELSTLLAVNSQECMGAPTDDLDQPAGKSNGDPDPVPLIASRHEAATRVSAKAKAGSAGAQHKLASLAAEHAAAARQSCGNTISPSKPLAETASAQAVTSIKTQTYTKTALKAAPANSPAAEGPACKCTDAGNGTTPPEPPIVISYQPETGCGSSGADSGSACTDSAFKPACTVRVNPADSEPSAAKLSQCGPDDAAVLIESLDETISTNIMPVEPQCKTHNLRPQPLVNASAAKCGSGNSMSSMENSLGPPCYSNKHASPASATSGFASTNSNV